MPENTQLREAFASGQSRMKRTIVVVDVIDSTAMKEQQVQATWLTSLGWLYDIITEIAMKAVPDVVVKYLGDGIMLVVGTDHTTDAVNLAIRIQEAITEAANGSGGARGVIDFTVGVGISTGEVVGFTTPSGSPDFVGMNVDKAFRLCSAANARAIFVDTATVGAANTMNITSEFGAVIHRTSDQYTGEAQKTPLKGFDQPVAYHEIMWGQQLYGVKSASVTASVTANSDRLKAAPTPNPIPTSNAPAPHPAGKTERHHGAVTYWNPDRGFGFIRDGQAGEEFHFTIGLLAYREDAEKLAPNKAVAFVAIDAQPGRRNRQAAAVLLVGEPAEGHLVNLRDDRPYGWIRVEDESRHGHLIYAKMSELTGRKVGDFLSFTVKVNDKGAYADQVGLVEDEQAA